MRQLDFLLPLPFNANSFLSHFVAHTKYQIDHTKPETYVEFIQTLLK